MYNMDQLTNNIAIPKHVLPNPSNLATSRSTVVVDDRDRDRGGDVGDGFGGGSDRDERYMNPNNFPNNNNHLDENGRGGETHPYSYDDDGGLNEESKGFVQGAEAQGKRGTWKGGLEQSDSRDGNGKYYIVSSKLSHFVGMFLLQVE
jgi:hypothetical protein